MSDEDQDAWTVAMLIIFVVLAVGGLLAMVFVLDLLGFWA